MSIKTPKSLYELQTQLSLASKPEWFEQIQKLGYAYGDVGRDVMNLVQPIPTLLKPLLNQKRTAAGVILPDRYTYATVALDPVTHAQLLEPNGDFVLVHSDTQLDAFDKAEAAYRAELNQINAVKSKLSFLINTSLSPESIAVLKSAGLKRYSDAQSDPVEMLRLINETHKLSDDANMTAAVNAVYNCKQLNFTSYVTFVTEFNRLAKLMMEMFIPSPQTTAKEVIEQIFKSFLMNNVDQTQFSFIISSVYASSTPVTLTDLLTSLMNFAKNSMQTVHSATSISSPKSGRRENRFTKNSMAALNAVEAICTICGERMPLQVNAQTGLAYQMCKPCYREIKLDRKPIEPPMGTAPKRNMTPTELKLLEKKKIEEATALAKSKPVTPAVRTIPTIPLKKNAFQKPLTAPTPTNKAAAAILEVYSDSEEEFTNSAYYNE